MGGLCIQIRLYSYISRRRTKPTKWPLRPAKIQISLDIRPVWSESSLSTWRNIGALTTPWAHSEDSDQTGRMPRLIWVFPGHTSFCWVLSCCSSHDLPVYQKICPWRWWLSRHLPAAMALPDYLLLHCPCWNVHKSIITYYCIKSCVACLLKQPCFNRNRQKSVYYN